VDRQKRQSSAFPWVGETLAEARCVRDEGVDSVRELFGVLKLVCELLKVYYPRPRGVVIDAVVFFDLQSWLERRCETGPLMPQPHVVGAAVPQIGERAKHPTKELRVFIVKAVGNIGFDSGVCEAVIGLGECSHGQHFDGVPEGNGVVEAVLANEGFLGSFNIGMEGIDDALRGKGGASSACSVWFLIAFLAQITVGEA